MNNAAQGQKTLLLTGASRGIGHATAKKFADKGWRVIGCSRQAFSPKCPWPGGARDHVQVDLSDPKMTMEAVSRVKELLGGSPLHALVNNAGVSPKGAQGERLSTLDTDLRVWGEVFHVNFFASVVLARGLQHELSLGRGSVVNVTSIAGSRVHPFAGAAYATSKAALAALTREMAESGSTRWPRARWKRIFSAKARTRLLRQSPCGALVSRTRSPRRSTFYAPMKAPMSRGQKLR